MNALWWVMSIGAGVAAGVGVFGSGLGPVRVAVISGITGPLMVAGASWMATTRTWARDPVALLPLLLRAFALKTLVFVAYVVVMVGVFDMRLRPFVISFTVMFLAAHLAEAYCLRRLMAPVLGSTRR